MVLVVKFVLLLVLVGSNSNSPLSPEADETSLKLTR